MVQNLQKDLLIHEEKAKGQEEKGFYRELWEYIDSLYTETKQNKRYALDAAKREEAIAAGFKDREARYISELRDLDALVLKTKNTRSEIHVELDELYTNIEEAQGHKKKALEDRLKIERETHDILAKVKIETRSALEKKGSMEAQLYRLKGEKENARDENERLRVYLARCKDDLLLSLRPEGQIPMVPQSTESTQTPQEAS